MNKKIKTEQLPTWDEIVNRVVESFNLDDVGANYGVSRWREHVERARSVEHAGNVSHAFTTPEVLDAVVDFFKADIAENMAIFKINLARNNRLMKMMQLRVALGEAQGVFVDDEEGERVVPELLAVIRVTDSAKTKMLRQVVQASMTLARNNGEESDDQPTWPAELGKGIQNFAKDLTAFISINGNEGRELVMRICQDPTFAETLENDQNIPNPIRFLAEVVVKVNTHNRLPDKERRIGFLAR